MGTEDIMDRIIKSLEEATKNPINFNEKENLGSMQEVVRKILNNHENGMRTELEGNVIRLESIFLLPIIPYANTVETNKEYMLFDFSGKFYGHVSYDVRADGIVNSYNFKGFIPMHCASVGFSINSDEVWEETEKT